MPRIFACLVAADLLLFLATGAFGFAAEKVQVERHILLAVTTLGLSCFIQVAAFTYLTVTGKMIGQAVHLGRLDPATMDHVRVLKRNFTGCLALVFLPAVVLSASGASAWRSGGGVTFHYAFAALVVIAHGYAWFREFDLIRRNAALVQSVLRQYDAARHGRTNV